MVSQHQKQEFIGGLVAAALAKKGVEIVVEKALERVAASPSTKMAKTDVKPAAVLIEKELQKNLQAQAEHRFDAEDHWRSRNVWSSLVGVITAVETIRVYWTDGVPQTLEQWWIPVGILVAALTPLWSRFVAKKPLFK